MNTNAGEKNEKFTWGKNFLGKKKAAVLRKEGSILEPDLLVPILFK